MAEEAAEARWSPELSGRGKKCGGACGRVQRGLGFNQVRLWPTWYGSTKVKCAVRVRDQSSGNERHFGNFLSQTTEKIKIMAAVCSGKRSNNS